jgi:hypothetical protein
VLNISKIQNESNSQPIARDGVLIFVVLNISKIQTESNSQPIARDWSAYLCCAQYIKDTN